jgi:hypothetical protein
MEVAIGAAVSAVIANPRTANWFNGVNNNLGKNFSANAGQATILFNHLVAFFGEGLGCTDPAFSRTNNSGPYNPSNVVTMREAHQVKTGTTPGFERAITADAFDAFNEVVVGFLRTNGAAPRDLRSVSIVLDSFRNVATGATATNQICNDATCLTSFEVAVSSLGFYPNYITILNGVALSLLVVNGTHSVSATTASNANACTAGSNPVTGSSGTITIPASTLGSSTTTYLVDTSACSAGANDSTGAIGKNSGILEVRSVQAATATPTTLAPTTKPTATATPTTKPPTTTTSTNSAVAIVFSASLLVAALLFL